MLEGIENEAIGMDCSIVQSNKYPEFFIVSTTDFFYPLVDDPYLQGRIGCANVLSDSYALGLGHIDNVLMILAASLEMDPPIRNTVTQAMIRGFNDCCLLGDTMVTGGQSVLNPWPIIGPSLFLFSRSLACNEHKTYRRCRKIDVQRKRFYSPRKCV